MGNGKESRTADKRKYYHVTESGRTALAEKDESWSQLTKAITQIMEKSK